MKKVIIDNLLSDLSTNQSLLEPLNNLLDESSGVIAESTTNKLEFICKASGKPFDAIACFNTNADKVEMFISLAETNRLSNSNFDNNIDWEIGPGGSIHDNGAYFDGSQNSASTLSQSYIKQLPCLSAGESFRLSLSVFTSSGGITKISVGDVIFEPPHLYRYSITCDGVLSENSTLTITVSDDFVGYIASGIQLKKVILINHDFSAFNNWQTSGPWVYHAADLPSDGYVSIDGSQTSPATIGQYPIHTNSNKFYKVTIETYGVAAGAITGIRLGDDTLSVNITTNGIHTFYIKPVNESAGDMESTLLITTDTDFHGEILDINVEEAYGQVIGEEYQSQLNLLGAARDRNFMFEINKTSSALPDADSVISLKLTSPTGTFCYLGILSIGEITEFDCPEYGLQLEMVNNEVSIPYADASRYRRFRSPQKVYSGQLALKTATKTIEKIREILRTKGSKPLAWVLASYRCKDTIIWGGIHENTQTFTSYDRDTLDFSIKEEL